MRKNYRQILSIYVDGAGGVKEVTGDMITAWMCIPQNLKNLWSCSVSLIKAVLLLLVVLIFPLLACLAPIIAIFTSHPRVTDDEIRGRMRKDFFRNGSTSNPN